MVSFGLVRRNLRQMFVIGVIGLIVTVPAIVSAAQMTERSIGLSSSSAGSEAVIYEVKFTAQEAATAFVVDFCANTPLIGQSCEPAAGFSAAGAATSTSGFAVEPGSTATHVQVNSEIAANEEVSVALSGINNPSNAGSLYARIVTYDGVVDYVSPTDLGDNVVDTGSVALSITSTVGVSGAVLETMTFCVSKVVITENCGNAGLSENAPVLQLGEQVGDVVALSSEVSEGSIYAQLSTNAASGATVRLKSNATGCGGLLRAGAAPGTCDIVPALSTLGGISNGQARFGVKAIAGIDPGSGVNSSGALQATNNYNAVDFVMNHDENTGVTSAYGDEIINSDGKPVSNRNMEFRFGAAIGNDTPAGLYSADLSLIATGKF